LFPIRDTIPSRRVPLVTWPLILVNVIGFVYQVVLSDRRLEQLVFLYGIVPVRYTHPAWARGVGFPPADYWPFLTSMFLHGGWFHVIVNMWTLWIFGDNVEDRMGHLRFLLFYLLCGVFAGLVHLVPNADSPIPVIGASGAIAGVLGAYFLLFPFSWIICVIPVFFYPLFVPIPASLYLLFWFISQLFSGTLSLMAPGHVGGIAFWAHAGGFAAGLLLCGVFAGRRARAAYPSLPLAAWRRSGG